MIQWPIYLSLILLFVYCLLPHMTLCALLLLFLHILEKQYIWFLQTLKMWLQKNCSLPTDLTYVTLNFHFQISQKTCFSGVEVSCLAKKWPHILVAYLILATFKALSMRYRIPLWNSHVSSIGSYLNSVQLYIESSNIWVWKANCITKCYQGKISLPLCQFHSVITYFLS